jgi:uncharacterized membrane protein YadS
MSTAVLAMVLAFWAVATFWTGRFNITMWIDRLIDPKLTTLTLTGAGVWICGLSLGVLACLMAWATIRPPDEESANRVWMMLFVGSIAAVLVGIVIG